MRVDTENPGRGPLLIISGEKDHTVPWAIANASYKQQKHNRGVTEITEIPNRGHALTIDSGWREVAGTALSFAQRFAPALTRRDSGVNSALPRDRTGGRAACPSAGPTCSIR